MSSDQFRENSGFPNFITILFIIQFVFFLFYWHKNQDDKYLLYFSIAIFLIGVFLAFAKMTLTMNDEWLTYSFSLFPVVKIRWKEVEHAEVLSISPIEDFAGWGIRYSAKYGWGYITNLDNGLFIRKTNGKKVVLSIKNRKAVVDFLKHKGFNSDSSEPNMNS